VVKKASVKKQVSANGHLLAFLLPSLLQPFLPSSGNHFRGNRPRRAAGTRQKEGIKQPTKPNEE